jgi:hypothetical protein
MIIAAVIAAGAVLAAQPAAENPAFPANGAAPPPAASQTLSKTAPAKTAPAKTAPAKPSAFADADTVVCKTLEVTGSLFPKKQCMTRSAWQQLTRDSQDLTNDITTRHQLGSPLGGQ